MNFSQVIQNLTSWSMQGYYGSEYAVIGNFFWAIVFMGYFGYIYTRNQSTVSAVVGTIILFSAFGATSVFAGLEIFTVFMHLVTALVLTGLLLYILSKRRSS